MSGGELLEMCTWQARVGGLDAAIRALQAAPRLLGDDDDGLAGAWTADAGPLNRLIHLWRYRGPTERALLHSTAAQGPLPPPDVSIGFSSELLEPLPFSPPLRPRDLGGFHEFRIYTYPTSALPDLVERWSSVIEWRQTLSPLVGAWITPAASGSALTRLVHCWAYRDANEWQAVRALARSSGRWPPPAAGRPTSILEQSSFVALPLGFSPLR
ncbi:MAG: NIPSNAP family protein [Rhodoferax sp.]|jgi:hypothetical protein|nr:NIPSNAP family protein [Rhodoferax sp.]